LQNQGLVSRGNTRHHKLIFITSPASLSRRITDIALKEELEEERTAVLNRDLLANSHLYPVSL
jgi:hypothetical protein